MQTKIVKFEELPFSTASKYLDVVQHFLTDCGDRQALRIELADGEKLHKVRVGIRMAVRKLCTPEIADNIKLVCGEGELYLLRRNETEELFRR